MRKGDGHMAQGATAASSLVDSREAGVELGEQLSRALGGAQADAVIVFAAPQHDYAVLLEALRATCAPTHLLGCSSAGEFQGAHMLEGGASALALRAPEMSLRVSRGTGLSVDRDRAAAELVGGFAGNSASQYRYRTAIILVDARMGFIDDLIAKLAMRTAGTYQFIGGGAGDNAAFERTPVFFGTDVYTDAAVALEILSNKPVGIGISHGWEPATPPMRVTAAEGLRLVSLNAMPAVEAFEAHAAQHDDKFDRTAPLPYFLHHILGIAAPGGYQLRVPLAAAEDGSLLCAAEVPTGSVVHIMRPTTAGAAEAAATAARNALGQLGEHRAEVALFFDCVATRLRLGTKFAHELDTLSDALGGVAAVGCNSHGQVARAEGQFSGFHNCTAVVCAIPR